jgi:two-component system chemotaxis sensor kinase CheA
MAESALLTLESQPGDAEAVNVVFRAFHTIKGVAGFLELSEVADFAHHAESVLSRVRDGTLDFSHSVADLTLRSSDLLRGLLDGIRSAMGTDDDMAVPRGYGELLAILSDEDHVARLAAGAPLLLSVSPETGVEGTDGGEAGSAGPSGGSTADGDDSEGSVRVRTGRLDRLLDLVGELVVSHSMVAEDPALRGLTELQRKVVRSEKILRELQDLTTGMRMVPMKPAFRKVTRVVRDVSRRSGKSVRLVTSGEDTELDRTMVDILADPLVHMVRNAVDHGIESPEERAAAGKDPEGVIRLNAYQTGGNVVVEISDDGRGLDREKLLRKAVERGVVESDRGLSDEDVYQLIFAAGFSTAEEVTDISGRGVGMDVVRKSVESLRGRVEIDSTPGRGSRFAIHLPLTLAITDGMLMGVGGERYIIPIVKIHSSLRPTRDDLTTVQGRGELVKLHEELLPVVRLHRLYEVPDAKTDPTEGLLVILGEGTRRFALMVDEILGQQQFVVKAMTGQVSHAPGVAGGAILGDGRVGLILDPDDILNLSRRASGSSPGAAA